jgi:hypothetical protein
MLELFQLLGWALSVVIPSANPLTAGLAVLNPAGQAQDSVVSAPQPAGNTSAPLHDSRKQLSALRRDAKTVEHQEHLARYFRPLLSKTGF